MSVWLDIVVPVRNPGGELLATAASLAAQTERGFAVLLSDNFSSAQEIISQFCETMKAADIPVRCLQPPFESSDWSHWNWSHSQGDAGWTKLLPGGNGLKPVFVERVKQRINARPDAQFILCQSERMRAGGALVDAAPFRVDSLTPAEFLPVFAQSGGWLAGIAGAVYRRDTWRAVGGYAAGFPRTTDLRLNAMLALLYGLEMIHEPLVTTRGDGPAMAGSGRSNLTVELWLAFRQMRNYAGSVNLPWPGGIWRQWRWIARSRAEMISRGG